MTEPWVDDAEFTVERYADYQGDEPPRSTASPTAAYSDQNTAYTDVLAGNADVLFLPASKMTSAEADFGDRLYSFDAPGIDYLGFPLTDERYSDVRVRQAISMSIDRDAVNTAIYGGLYEPATAFTPSAMTGTPDGLCGEFCEFDPDAAKALLAEAGGFDGTMEIVYPGGSGVDSLFEAYANQIRQNLGIDDVVAKPSTDWAEYYQGLVEPHHGRAALRPLGCPVRQPAEHAAVAVHRGRRVPRRAPAYSSPDVDALLDAADQAATPRGRDRRLPGRAGAGARGLPRRAHLLRQVLVRDQREDRDAAAGRGQPDRSGDQP